MNSDIRVLITFRRHRKRRKLERILGKAAGGYLVDLWISAALNRPDGVLTDWTAQDIADEVDFDGDPEDFVKALVDTRWADRLADGTVVLHGWLDHQGWASSSSTRSIRARINGMIKHHGRESAFKMAREKYGIDPADYGYVLNPAAAPAIADATADAIADATACGQHATADAIACYQQTVASAAASAPSPSPSPSPSQKDSTNVLSGAKGGAGHSRKPHFTKSASEYAEAIKAGCLKVEKRCNGSKRFNPWQWSQHWINKAGHPQAVVDSLSGVLEFWDTITGQPWAYADKIMKTKSGNYHERDDAAKSAGFKKMLVELAQMLGELPSVVSR